MLIGHLGKDAETRFTPSGTAVTNFSLATNRRYKNQQTGEWQEETDWHDIVLWKAEALSNYLQKGKQVYVEGRLQTRSWEDQSGNKRYRTEVGGRSRRRHPVERPARRRFVGRLFAGETQPSATGRGRRAEYG